MTREEAINEINKVFTSAYANYIVTALTEGATVSDIQHRWGRAYEAGVKDGLEQEPCEDAVSRKSVIAIIQNHWWNCRDIDKLVNELPPVTPQEPNTWSLDDAREDFIHDVYKELDFLPTNEEANRIIDSFDMVTKGIKQEPRWIPVKTRKLTDAEEQDMLENSGYYFNYMFDCLLPEDGEEVLITTSTGEATTTTFFDEGLNGCYFEFYEDDGDVIAWMPLPEPYSTESEDG